jgi:hypothetical protein
MTRACGECSKPCKNYGPPERHGHFVDQIVVCACGWTGVETEVIDDIEKETYQMPLEISHAQE